MIAVLGLIGFLWAVVIGYSLAERAYRRWCQPESQQFVYCRCCRRVVPLGHATRQPDGDYACRGCA